MFTNFEDRLGKHTGVLIAAVVVLVVMVAGARADVTVQRVIKSSGFGGIGASETAQKMMISGDKETTTGTTKFSGKFSSLMNKAAKEATSITRLDKELIWSLDPDKKTYTELTFEQMKKMMESMSGLLTTNPMKADSLRKAMAKLSTEVDVNKTGEKKTIAGLDCERVILSIRGETKDSVTKVTDTTWMKNDAWMAPVDQVPSELRDFDMKMAEKLGFAEGGALAGFLNQYADDLKKLQEKLKELKGYPVASTFSIVMSTHAQDQARAQAKTEEKPEQTAQAEEEKPTAGVKGLKPSLGGLFKKKANDEAKKKQEEKAKEKQSETQAQPGPRTLVELTTETQSITTAGVDASLFEIPAGYKKVEMHGQKK
ncbi:MAG: hypothetical protein WCE90_08445 [Candidatus Zixiibacteriota bacterium]